MNWVFIATEGIYTAALSNNRKGFDLSQVSNELRNALQQTALIYSLIHYLINNGSIYLAQL